jgi:hypothetical protein
MRLAVIALITLSLNAEVLLRESAFRPQPEGWSVWSQRAETLPRAFVDKTWSRGEPGSPQPTAVGAKPSQASNPATGCA